MLGDYMDYNVRPTSKTEADDTQEHATPVPDKLEGVALLADFEPSLEAEEGYDPYDHPIDRRFLE